MKVKEFMNKNVVTVNSDQTLMEVSLLFHEKRISGAPVLDPDGNLVGVISDSDIVKAVEPYQETLKLRYPSLSFMSVTFDRDVHVKPIAEVCREIQEKPVKEVMSTEVVTLGPEDTLEEAISLMNRRDLNRLPILKDGVVIGIITRADVLKCLASPEINSAPTDS